MTKYFKTMSVLLMFILLLVLSACESYEPSSTSDNKEVEEALKNEFDLIPQMPNTTEKDRDFFKKPESMGSNAKYTTNSNYKEIHDYYDEKLREHDWQFYKEEKVTDWGVDYGGQIVRYKKGDFVATLQYAGEKANNGWTYSFSMNWGGHYE